MTRRRNMAIKWTDEITSPLLTSEQVAHILDVALKNVGDSPQNSGLVGYELGGRLRFYAEDVALFLAAAKRTDIRELRNELDEVDRRSIRIRL